VNTRYTFLQLFIPTRRYMSYRRCGRYVLMRYYYVYYARRSRRCDVTKRPNVDQIIVIVRCNDIIILLFYTRACVAYYRGVAEVAWKQFGTVCAQRRIWWEQRTIIFRQRHNNIMFVLNLKLAKWQMSNQTVMVNLLKKCMKVFIYFI